MTTDGSGMAGELNSGERILWSERPLQGVRLRASDAFLIPFSLVWCGFAIFWETMVIRHKAGLLFELWGIPFIVVGLYVVFGRFFVDARVRERTTYAVTDQRVIIATGRENRRQVKSLPLRGLSEISLKERADGSGLIVFGPQYPFAENVPPGSSVGRYGAAPAFEIDNVREVHSLILNAQKSAA